MTESVNTTTYLRKMRALRAAEYALKARFAKIEWEETTFKPEMEELKERLGTGRSVEPILVESDEVRPSGT